jgi:hypothetical protein
MFIFGTFLFIPFAPWYLTYVSAIVAVWYFEYYEIILLGFLMDLMFASSHMSLVSKQVVFDTYIPYISKAPTYIGALFFTFISAFIFVVLQMIKKRVRFYA